MEWLIKLWESIWPPEKPKCHHDWSPCIVTLHAWQEKKPARICNFCRKWEPLTEIEFYAQFGESFLVAAKREAGEWMP
jgi:hypothetical protein